jgi:NitT/TauT family transport system ATP-binding protein
VASVLAPESAVRSAHAVQLENVGIAFPERRGGAFVAVDGVTLDVREGEFVAIVGPTGCGKSTLLNVAAGLLRPSSGICRVGGAPVMGVNRQAGYLFQADALMPWKTAIENVAIGLEVRGTPREQARAEAAAWLARVGLAAFHDRYPHQLSGGQRKRVGLVQVLILKPRLLLMDEPFGPLDAQTRAIMGELLLDLWSADRKAVMFVTHDLEEAIALADRVVIMSAGPGATIIGDHAVPLSRPRDITESRHLPGFIETHKAIWQQLKAEVLKAYAESANA